MNEKDIRYVLTIAACKSFTKAAELLFMSQPSLSRYVRELEVRLGVSLFNRKSSPIELTPEGVKYCAYANKMIDLHQQMLKAIKPEDHTINAIIRVGAPILVGEYIFSKVLPHFIKTHSSIQIQATENSSENLLQLIIAKHLDVAVVCLPEYFALPSITTRFLFNEQVYLVANKEDPAILPWNSVKTSISHPLKLDLSQLDGVTLIHCRPAILSTLSDEILKTKGMIYKHEIKASNFTLALDLVIQGVGFTCALESQLRQIPDNVAKNLVPISMDFQLSYYLIGHTQQIQNSSIHSNFIDAFLNEYQS